ncbi:MAG: serine hydroxymethyltransferase [Candidatus Lindowbacteria bacterium]|nr:serine hydroxymethyltransferase [Candidatus Lindowbacteria bacterium]
MKDELKSQDPDVANLIEAEMARQNCELQMIASENSCSEAVLQAMGSALNNKYAEGYPGKRYYFGCSVIDDVETLAINRLKEVFGSDHANVQPHSGSSANMAAYFALCNAGDKIIGMSLSDGGHLTHGLAVNFSGILYDFSAYGVNPDTGYIDYDQIRDLALEVKPKVIVTGASAYPRKIDFEAVGNIAKEVGASHMADMAHYAGLIAVGLYPSPVNFADIVTSTAHKTLRGPRSGFILCKEEYAKAVDKAVFPGLQGGPLEHVIAGKAVCFKEALGDDFKKYQTAVLANAQVLAEVLLERGYNLVSGGTDCHLVLVDLRDKDVTGKAAATALEKAGIAVNHNTVPGETRSPFVTSGIRIGTPSITTRGMRENEMRTISSWIADVLDDPTNATRTAEINNKVSEICEAFPLYVDGKALQAE